MQNVVYILLFGLHFNLQISCSFTSATIFCKKGTQSDRRTDEATLLKLTKSKMKPISKETAERFAKVLYEYARLAGKRLNFPAKTIVSFKFRLNG
jgi:hypothetical protein